MNILRALIVLALWCSLWQSATFADGRYLTEHYPAGVEPGKLPMAVSYTLWVPDGVKTLRGVIVHQHGCGTGACQGGETAAYDLQWQALAKKWDCALLGPRFHQEEQQNCRLWCDPRNGSAKMFLQALHDFGYKHAHPELDTVPWVLWGHSGGAFWSSLMQTMSPERIVAIWFRSGGAINAWEKEEIPKPEFPEAAFQIPMMCNPGIKERDDQRYVGAWTAATGLFQLYRSRGAPISFAADPKSAHDCGDSRYLAIPFLDACLELRLPDAGSKSQALKPIDQKKAWLAPLFGEKAVSADQFTGEIKESVWLPNEGVAKAWAEYVKDGAIADETPPPSPTNVKRTLLAEGPAKLRWEAASDLESGIQKFVILRDGKPIGQVPEKPVGKFGRPAFQSLSYHDTPEKPLLEMIFIDKTTEGGKDAVYEVISVNTVGRESKPAPAGN